MESTKLSFSLSAKPSSKPPKRPSSSISEPDSTHLQQQFVTEFDPSKTLTQQTHSNFSIPRLENTWNPYKKMKNLDLPMRSSTDDPDLRFEVEAPSTADANDSSMSYGLNLRSNESDDVKEGKVNNLMEEDRDRAVVKPSSTENVLLKKFKEDMMNLPDDRGMEEFDDVPVEGFGAALLKAYGWTEGKGIGRNAKEDVKVVQYVRRPEKEGLGFVPEAPKEQKGRKFNKEVMVAQKGADGKTRHVVGADEKLVPRELKGIHVGKVVRIVEGRHFGLKGKVLKKFEGGSGSSSSVKVVLKLKNDEEVTVGIRDVAELGSVDEGICLEELKSKAADRRKIEKNDYREDSRRSGERGGRDDRKKDNNKTRYREDECSVRDEKYSSESYQSNRGAKEEKSVPVSWLTSHIRVRIISKDFKGGKLYLKKGQVVDVVGRNICDISLDESKQLIQGVHQDILETAVPKERGPVLILYGKYKGVFGYLVERNMKKETGVVQDADSHELLNVHLEQIAEYVGDPSTIGY